MIRVAYITLAPFISGAERSLQMLLRYLPEVDISPLVVCPPDSAIIRWCAAHQIPYVLCQIAQRDKWHPFRWWTSVRQIRSELRSNKIDLVHSNQLWSYPAAGAAGHDLGLPRVCHIRDEISPQDIKWYGRSGFEGMICVSRYIEKATREAWPNSNSQPRIDTLLNPVELLDFDDAPKRKLKQSEARRHLGIGVEKIVFGFIGQIIPLKGLQILLDSLAELAGNPDWELVIAGKDPRPGAPHEKFCRQKVLELGIKERVRFIGYQGEVAPFYSAIDAAVVPSLEEPLGRVPLEAGAFGKPSIAFSAGGLPETILNGETGILVEVGNKSSLSQALRSILKNPNNSMGLQARKKVERDCSPSRYIRELQSIYKQLLD